MRIVAFIGSPRKGGNSDQLADAVLAGAAEAGQETEKVYLTDYALTPIGALYGPEESWADKHQGVADELIAKMVAADVVVLASPIYWFSISGLLKLFIDRWALYCRDGERLMDLMAGKRMVTVLSCADADPIYLEHVTAPLEFAARWLKMQWVRGITVPGVADPADLAANPETLLAARQFGARL